MKVFDRFLSTLSILFSYALHSSTCFLSHLGQEGDVWKLQFSVCPHLTLGIFFFPILSCVSRSPKPLLTELFRGKLLPIINSSSQSYLHIPHCKYWFSIFSHLYFPSMDRMPATITKVKKAIYIEIKMALDKTKVI